MNSPDNNISDENEKQQRLQEQARDQSNARWRDFITGIAISNLVGIAAIFAYRYILREIGNSNSFETFVTTQFVVLPMGMGIVASFYWRKLRFTGGESAIGSLAVTALALFCSFIFLREGVLCIVMALPLLFFFVFAGVTIGQFLWKRNTWLGMSTLPLLAAMLIADSQMPHHHAAIVADEILIRATPAEVWRYIASYPANEKPADYWLWKIGLPIPIQSTSQGAFVGAKRDCRFSGNVVFEEKIVEVQPARVLTFDVTKQPDHPEINGHFNLDRGRFELRDNGDGTTTLVGTTWYRLHVYPSQYFDLWAQDIIRRVHFRVMNHIKELAERDSRKHHRILSNSLP